MRIDVNDESFDSTHVHPLELRKQFWLLEGFIEIRQLEIRILLEDGDLVDHAVSYLLETCMYTLKRMNVARHVEYQDGQREVVAVLAYPALIVVVPYLIEKNT